MLQKKGALDRQPAVRFDTATHNGKILIISELS